MSKDSGPRPLNAWKHGGYSNLGVLPGEDPQEFERLHQSLIDEYMPSGPSECDMVMSLARYMWRKSRLTIYGQATKARKFWGDVFAGASETETELALVQRACSETAAFQKQLPLIEELRKWRREAEPQTVELNKQLIAYANLDKKQLIEVILRTRVESELARLGDQITVETLIEEIDLDERLEKRIERLTKRLVQLKAEKQILGLGPRWQKEAPDIRRLSSQG
jgi:hypothetical protein